VSEESFVGQVKRLLVGAPIPSHLAHHERFSRVTGLAILSSDPLSSVAYATEEILRVLTVGGVAALSLVTPIGAVIATMLAIVVFSYRQTIHAYPNGGGAYIVAKENLGRLPSLLAASSLLIDYVLTVAVSIAAGVAAITSAVPHLGLDPVTVCLGFVGILMLGNLRGIRESGRLFAGPTYFFIVSILVMIAVGGLRYLTGTLHPVPVSEHGLPPGTAALPLFVLLTAFSNGCTALTGVEAVSNGVPAFRPPESRNAAQTLVAMAVLSITMFIGITLLAHAYAIVPNDSETVVSQIARATFGGRGLPYYAVQAATMAILVLAANTAYADFPRLASILARDRFLPRQFMNQGDRLAFSNGILILSVLASTLLVIFGGDTHALIPLYMIGVFVSFTLSQAGMVVHWRRLREPGWRSSAAINGFGALVTGVVLVIVATTKAAEGAWIILLMIPVLVTVFEVTRRHYEHVASELTLRGWSPDDVGGHVVLVPIGGVQRAVVKALRYARTLSRDVRAVYVEIDSAATAAVRAQWPEWGQGVELVVLDSPFRSLMEPLLEYIEDVQRADPAGYVTVILPEFVPGRLWQHLLHNQHALLIKGALLFKPNVVVTSVPFHLGPPSRIPLPAPAAGVSQPPGSWRPGAAGGRGPRSDGTPRARSAPPPSASA
jgi:amino acid transporter